MKKMKKFLTLLLAATMAASLSVSAFAVDETDEDPDENQDENYTISAEEEVDLEVNGTFTSGADAAEKIGVDITWDKMEFTYTDGESSYNPDDHKTTVARGTWSTNTATITITNHSNVPMRAAFSFTATADGIKGVLSQDSVIIASAEQEKYQNNTGSEEEPVYDAPKASTAFGIDPTSSAISADGSLGTVTVSLAKYDGFAYDVTDVSYATLQDALSAAYRNGYRTFAITGEDISYTKTVLSNFEDGATIDLTLCDVTTIEQLDFSGCKALKSITLPKATTIKDNAFDSCTSLESVNAPSATDVWENAFRGCTALTSISLPAVATVGQNAFNGCTTLTTVSLPKCTELVASAFSSCTNLTTVELPLATKIGNAAFANCTSLAGISLPEVTKIDNGVFSGCSTLTTVSLPKCTQVGDHAFNDCTALTTITLPEVTTAGDSVFSGCTELATVSLPKCTTLGTNTFYECSKLTSVSLPLATGIGECAFYQCTSLTDISLPAATKIGNQAFRFCNALKTVSLPKCTNVGDTAFSGCDSLESLTFGTPVTAWGQNVLTYGKTSNVTLTVANGQKTFAQTSTGNPWYITGDNLTGGTNVAFCGLTFKEIIISAPAT